MLPLCIAKYLLHYPPGPHPCRAKLIQLWWFRGGAGGECVAQMGFLNSVLAQESDSSLIKSYGLPFFSPPDCIAGPCTSTCPWLWLSHSRARAVEGCGMAVAKLRPDLLRFTKITLQSHLKWAEAQGSLGMRVLMKQNHFPAMSSTFSCFIA